jgi:aldose 1-epimerase
MQIKVNRTPHLIDGYFVEEYSLLNDWGFELRCTNFGCTITHLLWPNADGTRTDILLGYDHLAQWFTDKNWFGSTAGRCCNRIKNAKFRLEDKMYAVTANTPPHHLHGGVKGFNMCNWRGYPEQTDQYVGVHLYLLSKDGDEGYPGNLSVEALLALSNKNELIIEYRAMTDKVTLCNLTSHPYFNLNGLGSILDHEIYINADQILVNDADSIPTGDFLNVRDNAFDFRSLISIEKNLKKGHQQIDFADGIDQNFVLKEVSDGQPNIVVYSSAAQKKLCLYTNQCGVQFYTGNHLNLIGKNNLKYEKHSGLCLETQGFPNAINYPHFPSVVLKPGEKYWSWMKIKLEDGQ